jgi:glycosyltransferase involved in cell wall biosynthesis
MKTALIHYWLVNERGGEKVLAELADLFPNAHLFTHVYDPKKIPQKISRLNIRTTFIDLLPFAKKLYQSYLPLMPWALHRLNLSEYDLIISSESGPAKGIRKPPNAVHICYCHTPMRYLWDMADYYYKQASPLKKIGMKLLLPALRKWDLWSATQVDHFVANSHFVAERIQRIYGRDAEVIYPPVDTERFSSIERAPQDFYLFFGQLTSYKRADIAIETFAKLGKKLVIAGSGEELESLQELAQRLTPDTHSLTSNIEFVGRVSDEKLNDLYAQAKALIFPGVEDFGIIPVEAQAAGCPIIAYGAGGALETVIENETGVFFNEQTPDSLAAALIRFESMEIDSETCRSHAQQFSTERFQKEFMDFCQTAGCKL